jgi:uncharacterized membrane protein (DUF2068 family)
MMLPLIGTFKLVKAVLILAVALGLFRLAHDDASDVLERWATQLHIDPNGEHLGPLVQKILVLDERRLRALSAGMIAYATLFLVEGVGLIMKAAWAEWLTVIATASLVPLEVYEIVRHPRPLRVAVLVVNLAIVWYLVARLRREGSAAPG